jgi:ATP-dependent Clp protease ATP-binding subunit ClpB
MRSPRRCSRPHLIEPAHLLLFLLDQQQGGGTRPLAKAGVNVLVLRERLTEALDAAQRCPGRLRVSVGNDPSRPLNVPVCPAARGLFIASAKENPPRSTTEVDAGKALKGAGESTT